MADKLKVIYCQATPEDGPAIFTLLDELEGDRSQFDITRFYVAKVDNNLIGCIRTKMFNAGCLELASLAVNKDYQRQGIGSRLVKELLSKETMRPIFLLTELEKENFYNKFNFNIIQPSELQDEFKKEYERIINLPFAKGLKVIAMIIK